MEDKRMKYKVGDKTLLGEIIEIDKLSTNPYVVKVEGRKHWLTESEIGKIIIKPKRNIDHLIELWENGKPDKACAFVYDNFSRQNAKRIYELTIDLFKPYIEPRKYPILTPEELKAAKWLVEGGYETIVREHGESYGCYGPLRGRVKVDVKINPISKILKNSTWITETPINLKELLEAQEGV
jgi:hypothetical protein